MFLPMRGPLLSRSSVGPGAQAWRSGCSRGRGSQESFLEGSVLTFQARLHSASVMEAGPVVYNHAHQERRTRRDRTRAYTELVEKSRTKRVSFQLADIYNLFIFHLKN